MNVYKGKLIKPQKVVIYGVEGIGKSTFASKFPNPLFIDTEGSTNHIDAARMDRPKSWNVLIDQVRYVRDHPDVCGTLVIDTADWAEQLCVAEVLTKNQKTGIEEFGYGKGYVFLAEEFAKLLLLLEEVIDRGINVVMTAHAKLRKFEQPDELGAYDRWEMKLQRGTAPIVKEWADMVLFANYKTYVVNVDNQGAQKGKNKAQGGARVMYTTHHPCWDAKNRHDLPDELPFEYGKIAHCIPIMGIPETKKPVPDDQPSLPLPPEPAAEQTFPPLPPDTPEKKVETLADSLPRALIDLMVANTVTQAEIQEVVAQRGYYPQAAPIENYDPEFIQGVLVSAWDQVYEMILANRPAGTTDETVPF